MADASRVLRLARDLVLDVGVGRVADPSPLAVLAQSDADPGVFLFRLAAEQAAAVRADEARIRSATMGPLSFGKTFRL